MRGSFIGVLTDELLHSFWHGDNRVRNAVEVRVMKQSVSLYLVALLAVVDPVAVAQEQGSDDIADAITNG